MAKTRSQSKPKPRIKTIPWDAADYLKSDQEIAHYLEAVLEDGDPALVAAALGDVARAKGMAKIARKAGLGRESLYKALSPEGNPELATVLKVLRAMGLKLKVAA
jgi:probable addiction module antidote protein